MDQTLAVLKISDPGNDNHTGSNNGRNQHSGQHRASGFRPDSGHVTECGQSADGILAARDRLLSRNSTKQVIDLHRALGLFDSPGESVS